MEMFTKKALFISYIASIQTNIWKVCTLEEAIEFMKQSAQCRYVSTMAYASWSTMHSKSAAEIASAVSLTNATGIPAGWPMAAQK